MSSKLFDRPFQRVIFRHVYSASCRAGEMRVFDVFRDWHKYVDVVGDASFFVVALDFDKETDFGAGRLFNDNIDGKEGFDSDIESVAHEFELTIRGDESYKPLIFKLSEPDALMEFNVVELDSLASGGAALGFVIGLVIQA